MICPDYSYSLSSRFYLQSIAREITKILRFGEDRSLSAYKLQSCDARLRKMDSTRFRIGRENLRIYESLHELSTDLAEYISLLSEACVKENGCFSIALSGGTLISLMRKLSEPPYNRTVDWRKWHVFWTDERVVSKVHVDSNYRLAKEDLFSKVPVVSSHLHSINDTLSAEEAAAEYKFILRQLVKGRIIGVSESNDCPKFDLILLNMGSDGHVASLFPDHAALDEKDEWVTFMIDSPVPPPERITFTMPVINSASNVAMVVTGDDKAESVKLAMNETISISEHSFPARLVRPIEGNLMWFLDRSSASKLDNFLPTD